MLISDKLLWRMAQELVDSQGVGAIEDAWRRAGLMHNAGNALGFEMWADVAKKIGAIRRRAR